jgi:hypothetical protein
MLQPRPVHAKRRYGKSALGAAVLALALALPGLARAELVPGTQGARDGALALEADGTPQVAYVDASDRVFVATRAADGTWASDPVPVSAGTLVGFAPGALLVESNDSRQLWLARQQAAGWRVTTIATAPRGALLGLPGLALDPANGANAAVAYTVLTPDQRSTLRLALVGATRRDVTVSKGFPKTLHPPSAVPVYLPSGAVRVVESSDGEVIEWYLDPHARKWIGQFLYANSAGEAGGLTRAVAPPRAGVWSAWTELFDAYGESHVLVALRRERTYTAILSTHAFVVQLTADLEVAADDYVELPGNRLAYAAEILSLDGTPLELDGDILGYASDRGGRQYLLRDAGGLEWFRAAAPPAARVSLTASPDPKGIRLTGRVSGVSPTPGASVELWGETPSGPVLRATLPLAADGSFTTVDAPTGTPLTFRAVYRDPANGGLPVSALVRTVFG